MFDGACHFGFILIEKTILRSKMERRKKLQSIFVEQTDEVNYICLMQL